VIVADSGPIIVFARIGRLNLLQQVLEELIIPEGVYKEVVERGAGRAGAAEVERGDWIHRREVSRRASLSLLPSHLQAGQQEAIVLAQELGAQLLIDESEGRKIARERGIKVVGSLGVLAEAKRMGLIGKVRPIIEEMRAATYRIGDNILSEFLQRIGEGDVS
jgi:predicted nucleic acid-binding protein